ncbi:MAG: hypothetical protein AAGN82_28020 [Myxococcota bacterium]
MHGTAYPATARPTVEVDPLAPVQRLGRKAAYNGLYGGLIIALLSHIVPVSSRDFTTYYLRLWEESLRLELKSYMLVEVEVDMLAANDDEPEDEPEPEPEAIPEPEPEPEPETPPDPTEPEPDPLEPPPDPDEPPPPDDPYNDIEPPPEAAQAGNALTQDAVDLTGEGLVVNRNSDGYRGGYSSGRGKGQDAVNDPNAKTGGTRGGRGKGDPVPKPRPKYTGPDRSAPPQAIGSWNSCGFPPQANLEQIDRAVVIVNVTVSASGRAVRASVQNDPGYGFGALARSCAMAKRYRPGKNRAGEPVTKSQSYRVKFTR